MTWLYQPLPQAGVQAPADVTVALSGSASTCDSGSVGTINFVGQAITSAQGDFGKVHVVRLRSRKAGGTQTAEHLLNSQVINASAGTVTLTKSVLLGGSGVAVQQNAFASKQISVLLGGQQRQMSQGFLTSGSSTGFIPSWVQLPTQLDEQIFYDTDFGLDSGKDFVREWDATDKHPNVNPGFADTPPSYTLFIDNVNRKLHEDTEGDDLWTHYMQYKRTGQTRYLNWAQAWRDYFCDDVSGYINDWSDLTNPNSDDSVIGEVDHTYGQGLVIWGMERNDLTAKNKAIQIGAHIEPIINSYVPGTTNASLRESRGRARMLIVMCYLCMMEPIARWENLRNHMIEVWLQSPGWHDTTHPTFPTIIGGNHFCGRPNGSEHFAGWKQLQYDQGLRWNASFMYGLHTEALWLAYKQTNRTDVRDMLIEMGRFVLHYAWDPLHANPMCGNRWGYRPLTGAGAAPSGMGSPGFLHDHADEFIASDALAGIPQNPYPPLHSNPSTSPTDNYEASLINNLVYAYKLTGEAPFLKRAREHHLQHSIYLAATGTQTKQDPTQVYFYMDTQRNSDTFFFNYNKGSLQYAAHLFENGGDVAVEPSATWIPPYPVPTSPGQVVKIAGGSGLAGDDGVPDATTQLHQNGDATPSLYPTNTAADVRPTEVGGGKEAQQMWTTGDTRTWFIRSYSQAGAVVIAGSGGHHGTPCYGAMIFDLEDARFKRIWTTEGNPGVDNVSQARVDIRTGTKVHGCVNFEPDLVEWYLGTGSSHGGFSGPDWDPTHWQPGVGGSTAAARAVVPLQADPRNQYWEISRAEGDWGSGSSAAHAWPFPGEFGGLVNGRFPRTGYVTPSLPGSNRNPPFNPPVAGTLEPTQSELPAPAHIWGHYFELSTENGGGPRGSIVCARHQSAGDSGSTSLSYSHRFDLHTGIWHQFSVNSAVGSSTPTGSNPHFQESAIVSAHDPVTDRVFMIAKRYFKDSGGRINYLNISDRTWRSFQVGSGGASGILNTRTENMWVDWHRRLLLLNGDQTPWLWAFDLQTIDSQAIPSLGAGGWRVIPYDDIPGTQSGAPWAVHPETFASNVGKHTGAADANVPWRYCPMNGKYYRVHCRYQGGGFQDANTALQDAPGYQIRVLQRLTPPAIVTGSRVEFYYTTESLSGRWTLDEMTINDSRGLPVPDAIPTYSACGFSLFHWVEAIQCFVYIPLDHSALSGRPVTRRAVYLIKPY